MMKNSIENIIKENKIMVIDGSMSTPLENRGVSLNSKLWTAKILAEQPELIKQVHKNYFKAGADCGITCSYQASIPGLMENGSAWSYLRKIKSSSSFRKVLHMDFM